MKNIILNIAASVLLSASMMSNASVIINVNEVGNDVVFNTSGSLDLAGATFLNGIGYDDGFISAGSNWYVASGAGNTVDNYALTSFDGAFGTNSSFFNAPSSVSGDDFFIWGNGGGTEQVGVEVGYISGDAILSQMIFSNSTIAGFGMIDGIYNYLLPNDSITLNISSSNRIPEPSIIALFAVALLSLGITRRRKRN